MYNKTLIVTLVAVIVLSVQLTTATVPTADSFGVEDSSGYRGTHVLIPVNITNSQNDTIQCIMFNISYDNSVITVVGAHKGTLTPDWGNFDYNNLTWGTRVCIATGGDPLPNGSNGSVVVLNISIIGEPGEATNMNLSDIQLSDETGTYVGTAPAKNGTFSVIAPTPTCVFDTDAGTYPSSSGIHTGTITLKHTIDVAKLYTYPCAGTGGHTEYVRFYGPDLDVTKTWNGYIGDYHSIIFVPSFTLQANTTYNYEISTGSYPQIIHEQSLSTANGTINCTQFTDANGKTYTDWIPAIRLEGASASGALEVTPDQVDILFDKPYGSSYTEQIRLTNRGKNSTRVTITSSDTEVTPDSSRFELAPGDSRYIDINARSDTQEGEHYLYVTADGKSVRITVTVTYVAKLSVSPSSSINFGTVASDVSSVPKKITVREDLGYEVVNFYVEQRSGNGWVKASLETGTVSKNNPVDITFTLKPGSPDYTRRDNKYTWKFVIRSSNANAVTITLEARIMRPPKLGRLDDERLELKFDKPKGTVPG
jgi:hypothetical protein